ncbi:hypothetical protein VNO77_04657 [Canavalia gladiata]|uniref:Bet v I/Major latex protein domain-containing protein n=1 Tax=Canavalia gladiata TaxID=3824 RepID=A0AAN9R7Y5_CANGL
MAQPEYSLVAGIQVKASVNDFYESLKGKKQHRVHDVASDHIHKVDVHEGEWEKSGTVKEITFTVEIIFARLRNKEITYFILEGDMLKYYKSYKVVLHVLPKGGEHNLVKWTLSYEKVDDSAPEPTKYRDLLVKLTYKIDAHLVQGR